MEARQAAASRPPLASSRSGYAARPNRAFDDAVSQKLHLLPASQARDKDALTAEGVARVIDELRERFDWVICDSPAGIERGATLAMRHTDIAVVVTNPEISSVRDSDRIVGLMDSKTERAERGEFAPLLLPPAIKLSETFCAMAAAPLL